MRRIVISVLLFLVSIFAAVAFTACNNSENTENTKQEEIQTGNRTLQTYTVEFFAAEGGKLYGIAKQQVKEGESTLKIRAAAYDGYEFICWVYEGSNEAAEAVTTPEIVIENVNENCSYTATFEKIYLTVNYTADEHGTIEGALQQKAYYGESTESVTAVPDRGYRFLKWSDGVEEATRYEKKLIKNKELTAYFEPIKKEFTYNYKFADRNCEAQTVTLTYGSTDNVNFAVPEREHGVFGGWYADKYLTKRVADEHGNAVFQEELFYSNETQLYAKWIAENTNTYKILIVYVTELNAVLTKRDLSGTKEVNYKMTETERQICRMVTEKISFELNDLAVANFQVDEYFTTVPLTKENVWEGGVVNKNEIDNEVWAYNIPEVKGMLESYDSVLVSFSMDDYYDELQADAGNAITKFGIIHFDGCFTQLLYLHEPIENLLDPLHYYWNSFLEPYLHELAHTIELRVNNMYDFHTVIEEYCWNSDNLMGHKLYFLGKAVINGETVGIPYKFWEGKVAIVHYEAYKGGYIVYKSYHSPMYGQNMADDVQSVLYGDDAIGVVVRVFDGYEFVGWSDGVETPERQDLNILADFHVYAIFRPIEE